MTYADQFLKNKYATIATSMSYGKTNDPHKIYECADYLCKFEEKRSFDGKDTTYDHLKQEAVKFFKNNG